MWSDFAMRVSFVFGYLIGFLLGCGLGYVVRVTREP